MPVRLSAEKGKPSRQVGHLALQSRVFSFCKRDGSADAVTNRYVRSLRGLGYSPNYNLPFRRLTHPHICSLSLFVAQGALTFFVSGPRAFR